MLQLAPAAFGKVAARRLLVIWPERKRAIVESFRDGSRTRLEETPNLELIFGEANPVQSEALMRLDLAGGTGMLAFGSSDPRKFDPGHGTDLLAFLGAAIERLLVQRMSENDG